MAKKYTDDELDRIESEWRNLIEDQSVTYLLADPSTAARRVLFNALTKEGCENILEARKGQEALLMAERTTGKLVVIVEMDLKDMDGQRFLKKFFSVPSHAEAIVLMTSQDLAKEQLLLAMKAGAKGFLKKPTPPETFVAKLQELGAL